MRSEEVRRRVTARVDVGVIQQLLDLPPSVTIVGVIPIRSDGGLTLPSVGFKLAGPDFPHVPKPVFAPIGTLEYEGPFGITHTLKGWQSHSGLGFIPIG